MWNNDVTYDQYEILRLDRIKEQRQRVNNYSIIDGKYEGSGLKVHPYHIRTLVQKLSPLRRKRPTKNDNLPSPRIHAILIPHPP